MSQPFGFLNIDKPPGMTSHDVVARIRRSLKVGKAGHAGTLDPLATGVLVICLGAATRLSEYVMQSSKRYSALVRLGITTDTYDAEGQITAQAEPYEVTRAEVEQHLKQYLGEIEQIPPMYSAIKQGGRKLYELARAGEVVERTARSVRIEALSILDWNPPDFTLDVTCSAGTYIRSLAHDLGQSLGVGAHLAGLTRTASGRFLLNDAVTLDAVTSEPDWMRYLVTPQQALAEWPVLVLDASAVDHVFHGRSFADKGLAHEGLALAYDLHGAFIAILKGDAGVWKPHKVFARSD